MLGQYIASEVLWATRRRPFVRRNPGEIFRKQMPDEQNSRDIMVPILSKPFSSRLPDGHRATVSSSRRALQHLHRLEAAVRHSLSAEAMPDCGLGDLRRPMDKDQRW